VDPVKADSTVVAVCAECIETTQHALPGALPLESQIRRFRAADGKLRVDFGKTSIITDPATGERILLDHLLREARILMDEVPSIPAEPALPGIPRPPAVPGLPNPPDVVALGKDFIEGQEVEGMRYVFQALNPLSPPSITSWEVWTSTKLQMPVLTRTVGSFGVRTCICKCTPVAPPASTFQVPTGYTVIRPPLPR
jgi:hypothetical protein